jgi:DNA modification methylase
MKTFHKLYNQSSEKLEFIENSSIDLTVTSPPYPMIEMWDGIFSNIDPSIKNDLIYSPNLAFEKMHKILDHSWNELYRITKEGGFVCINIGDATRTLNDQFQIFMNHSMIIHRMNSLGFSSLPGVIWRKPTNSPNKFMGSGMYPAGAYITLEHEHILVFRKGGKKNYSGTSKINRRESAYFWEERNKWFSDLWEFKGTKQKTSVGESRERNAAFPIELPLRLISMYSNYGDTILDPFWGTGTTTKAAGILGRNSIGVEIDPSFNKHLTLISESIEKQNEIFVDLKLKNHTDFLTQTTKILNNKINSLNLKVMTKQETEMKIYRINKVSLVNDMEMQINYI